MCQLTFFYSSDIKLSQTLVGLIGLINTQTMHREGYGFFSKGKVFKTEKTPRLDPDYYSNIKSGIGTSGFFHVRKATKVFGKEIEISEKDSHPFQETIRGNVMTLAHNGTLDFKDKYKDQWKHIRDLDVIDSHVYLKTLKQVMETQNLEILEGMQKTMEMFYGKFAFMVNYKNNYYIFRGTSAQVHALRVIYANGKRVFLANTDKDTLINLAQYMRLVLPLLYGEEIKMKERSDVELLTIDTGYIFNPKDLKLDVIGKVVETTGNYTWTQQRNGAYVRNNVAHNSAQQTPVKVQTAEEKAIQKAEPQIIVPKSTRNQEAGKSAGFFRHTRQLSSTNSLENPFYTKIRKANLAFDELIHLFHVLYHKSILDATPIELDDFEDNVIRIIDYQSFGKRQRTYEELIGNTNRSGEYISRMSVATHPKLQPLYLLNAPSKLKGLLRE